MRMNSLYKLIHSLGQGECRFIEKRLSEDRVNAGVLRQRIYDTLKGQHLFDQELLKQDMSGWCSTARLAKEKTRLFNQILLDLATLNHRRSQRAELMLGLVQCNVLAEKGMMEEALEKADHVIDEAIEENESFLELVTRERKRTWLKTMDRIKHFEEITDNHNRLQTLSKRLDNFLHYRIGRDEVLDLYKQYNRINDETMRRGLERIINRPFFKDFKLAESFEAQECFHGAWSLYYKANGNLEQATSHQKEQLRLWEINTKHLSKEPHLYISLLANLASGYALSGKPEQCKSLLRKLEQVQVSEPYHQAYKFLSYELQFQLYHLNNGTVEKVIGNGPALDEGLSRFKKLIGDSDHISLRYNQAVANLIYGDHKQALRLLTQIVSMGKLNARKDLQGIARIIRLLLLAWKDDSDTLQHYLRNFGKYFKGERKVSPLKDVVERYTLYHWKSDSPKERKAYLTALVEEAGALQTRGVMGSSEVHLMAKARLDRVSSFHLFKKMMMR